MVNSSQQVSQGPLMREADMKRVARRMTDCRPSLVDPRSSSVLTCLPCRTHLAISSTRLFLTSALPASISSIECTWTVVSSWSDPSQRFKGPSLLSERHYGIDNSAS